MSARLRSAVTLAVLAVLLVCGAAWGYTQVTKPLPGKVDLAACVDTDYEAGQRILPEDVTISVLNGSKREGLAGRTLQLFEDEGFPAGQVSNVPPGTELKDPVGEIWVTDRANPAIALIRSRIGKIPVREVADDPVVGITVVVGDGFTDLKDGRPAITLEDAATICSPPVA